MRGVRVRLHVDAPTLSRLVEVLRTALEADVVVGFEVDLVEQARELLDELDDTAHAAGEDELDDLGPPREGGARVTVETDRADHRQRILEAADLLRYLRDGDGVTRLRVVMDVAPVVEPASYFAPAAHDGGGDPVASILVPGLGAVDLIAPAVPLKRWRKLVEGAWAEAARVPERFLDGMHTVLSDHWQGPIAFVWRPEGEFPPQHLTRTYPTDREG